MIASNLPSAKASYDLNEREKIKRLIASRGLCGLANDTKWNELIQVMRQRETWRPSYRFKCIDGVATGWDVEWFYHLPFPMISVEWLDIGHIQETQEHRQPRIVHILDHSEWMVPLLQQIGLDFRVGHHMIRIFGYSPRSDELFDQ